MLYETLASRSRLFLAEIPAWLKDYAVAPCGSKLDSDIQVCLLMYIHTLYVLNYQ